MQERIFALTWEALLVDTDEIRPYYSQAQASARAKEAEKAASSPSLVRTI